MMSVKSMSYWNEIMRNYRRRFSWWTIRLVTMKNNLNKCLMNISIWTHLRTFIRLDSTLKRLKIDTTAWQVNSKLNLTKSNRNAKKLRLNSKLLKIQSLKTRSFLEQVKSWKKQWSNNGKSTKDSKTKKCTNIVFKTSHFATVMII